ncbi:MAG: right-handed parallel beta-helix repeat-containing protein [Candidatus Bathyarchaeia archaeon]
MENRSKILALIFSIILSLAVFPLDGLLPTAKATYFEGVISIDTVWTLVDSPFILTGNVTVNKNVTLIIEPGVEVKFGGKFSIIVNGRLVAKGTQEFDRLIKITSNKETPKPGDWGTLYFNGTGQPPSLLENCIIEYGTSGTTIADGELTILSSVLRLNSENGVLALNGSATIGHNNLIYNNTASGINVSGGNVIVRASNVTLNGEGITLTGNLTTSNINITQNIITNNTYGIKLDMKGHNRESFVIEKNKVHSNDYGFYVSANNTFITRNYIYNNSRAGIFYGQGTHEAHFNDIYNNTYGIEVADATVNATYNYWGHWSGPYHVSLNPRGKGNPVKGDAANTRFIFFLSASIDHENHPPTAVLWTDKLTAALGQNVTFVGTNSFDVDEHGRVDYYLYDFGDGITSRWTTLSIFFHSYNSTGEYNATLQVRDDFNVTSNVTSTIIRVVNLPPLEVKLTLSSYIVDYNGTVSARVYVTHGTHPVDLANVTLFAVGRGFFISLTNSTDPSGYSTITFVAPNVKDVTELRVIARASMDGYADGSDYKYLRVLPPLNVALKPNREKLFSEESIMVAVNVTDAYKEPLADVHLQLFMNDLLVDEGLTDINGTAIFEFTAPLVYGHSTLTIRVEAFKDMYAKGFDTCVVELLPRELDVVIYRGAEAILSEESTQISVLVYWESEPVPDANVSLSANYGSFDQASVMTDSSGMATFTFTAPKTTVNITADIIATATKDGYVSGANWTAIRIMPKVLVVHVTADRNVTVSEEEINVFVHVEYDGAPISNASVTLSFNVSGLSPLTAFTNDDGNVTFTFNMTAIPHNMVIAITATASKDGYAENHDMLLLTAKPGNLTVIVYTVPSVVKPGEFSRVVVYVKCGNRPVADANVTITATIEGFTPMASFTDVNGYCELAILAPKTTRTLNVSITVDVAKVGYNSVRLPNCAFFNVVPEAGGIPWLTILLVLIPVLLVVVIVVLVKLGVIQVSFGEEEEGSVS